MTEWNNRGIHLSYRLQTTLLLSSKCHSHMIYSMLLLTEIFFVYQIIRAQCEPKAVAVHWIYAYRYLLDNILQPEY